MSYPAWISPAYEGYPKFRPDNFTVANIFAGSQVEAVGTAFSGKVYFEIVVNSASGQWCLGLSSWKYNGPNTRQNYNSTSNTAWVAENGAIFINGGYSGTSISSPGTTAVGIAYDPTAKLVWFTVVGSGSWNAGGSANPATGAGGFDVSALAAPLAPFVSTSGNAIDCTLNTTTFAGTAPSGFSNISGYVWDSHPYGYQGNYALSSGNLEFTVTSSSNGPDATVLAYSGVSSGKYYCEIYVVAGDGFDKLIGLIPTNYSGGNPLNSVSSTPGILVASNGDIYVNGTKVLTPGGGFAQLGIAIDATAKLIWINDAGGNWNGSGTANPATGVGGIDISGVTFPLTPFAAYLPYNDYVNITLNSGQIAYAHTPPTGFGNFPYGTSGGATPQLPYLSPLQRLVRSHFKHKRYAGHQTLRVAKAPPGTVVVPPKPYDAAQRLARKIAAHFTRTPYQGHQATRVGLGPRPVPPVPPRPYNAAQRLARTVATHFTQPKYQGRRGPHYVYGGGQNLAPRVSQVVLESLSKGSKGARAAQLTLETLASPTNAVRASQLAAEALVSTDLPFNIRVSQFVVEALVPYSEIPVVQVYPQLIGLTPKIVKSLKQSTGTGVGSSGREVRVGYWATPQFEWELTYDILADNGAFTGSTSSDIRTLMGFFLTVQGGLQPFYFRDPDDNTVTKQALGVGDGVTTIFPFVRTFGLGSFEETENVGGVELDKPLTIYVDNVAQTTGYSISTLTPVNNYIQFTTPPAVGAVITASFSFWYLCRFKDDSYSFNKVYNNLWEAKVTLFSLKG